MTGLTAGGPQARLASFVMTPPGEDLAGVVFHNARLCDGGARLRAPPYLIFNVAIASATHRIVMIQNLVTILLSWYPSF